MTRIIHFLWFLLCLQSYACRWAIYAGQDSESAEALFTSPAHGLCEQSYRTPFKDDAIAALYFNESKFKLRNHEINKDGWGVGWYSQANKAKRYRDEDGATDANNVTQPELQTIVRIRSKVILGHIRAASSGLRKRGNSHPFQFNNLLWMHNGGLPKKTEQKLVELIACSKVRRLVSGTTDSEHLGGIFVSNLLANTSCEQNVFTLQELQWAMKETIKKVEELEDGDGYSTLNLAASDGNHVLVTRYRTHKAEEPPSLYYARTENSLWVASEPLDGQLHSRYKGDTRDWIPLCKDEMLSYTVESDTLQLECLSEACRLDKSHRMQQQVEQSGTEDAVLLADHPFEL